MSATQAVKEDGTPSAEVKSTRERILDVALELFIEKGYDKTSLREIAEQLGFTKAALYYHFANKEDILMALHMRLHGFGLDALAELGGQAPTLKVWAELLDRFVDQMIDNRKILLLHERNQAAFEVLHRKDHDAQHEDLQEKFRAMLSDERVNVADRVRMAISFGAVMSGIFFGGEAFDDVPTPLLGQLVREAIKDLLG
jgi:AcrR family transcriptional regulator